LLIFFVNAANIHYHFIVDNTDHGVHSVQGWLL